MRAQMNYLWMCEPHAGLRMNAFPILCAGDTAVTRVREGYLCGARRRDCGVIVVYRETF